MQTAKIAAQQNVLIVPHPIIHIRLFKDANFVLLLPTVPNVTVKPAYAQPATQTITQILEQVDVLLAQVRVNVQNVIAQQEHALNVCPIIILMEEFVKPVL